uniref:Uncharacterized protein n=1 Tax=Heterorhabditis bacteriophora TaxID=37862 RepID=A0A1I7X7E4_HETBA
MATLIKSRKNLIRIQDLVVIQNPFLFHEKNTSLPIILLPFLVTPQKMILMLAADCLDGFNSGNYDDSTKKTISQSLKRLNKAVRKKSEKKEKERNYKNSNGKLFVQVKSAKKCRRYAKNQTTMSDCSSILQQSKYKQKNANQMKIVIDACSTCIENYC